MSRLKTIIYCVLAQKKSQQPIRNKGRIRPYGISLVQLTVVKMYPTLALHLFGLLEDVFAHVTRKSPGIGPQIHYTDLPTSKQHTYVDLCENQTHTLLYKGDDYSFLLINISIKLPNSYSHDCTMRFDRSPPLALAITFTLNHFDFCKYREATIPTAIFGLFETLLQCLVGFQWG